MELASAMGACFGAATCDRTNIPAASQTFPRALRATASCISILFVNAATAAPRAIGTGDSVWLRDIAVR